MPCGIWLRAMWDETDELIHQAIENETVNIRDDRRCGYIRKSQVSYIIHEAGVSVYYGDFHIGEFATQSEAVRKVGDMADHYI